MFNCMGPTHKLLNTGKNITLLNNNLNFFPVLARGRWSRIPGVLKQIDTGYSRAVWGVNRVGYIYKLRRNRRSWRRVGGRLIHVSSGEGGVWGVSRNHQIWYRLGKKYILLTRKKQ